MFKMYFSYVLLTIVALITVTLFFLFGGIMYYFGYEKAIEKANIEITKEKENFKNILNMPCATCVYQKRLCNKISNILLIYSLQAKEFNTVTHTEEEYKKMINVFEDSYFHLNESVKNLK